jgi:hypothetical protein
MMNQSPLLVVVLLALASCNRIADTGIDAARKCITDLNCQTDQVCLGNLCYQECIDDTDCQTNSPCVDASRGAYSIEGEWKGYVCREPL